MNILALETSGIAIGVAALRCDADGAIEPLAVLGLEESRQLSRQIIAALEATLQHAGWTLDEVDALAVGLGPGSWTSLRIGLTTCKTLAQVRGWQLAGVPTFDAMAQAVWRQAGREQDNSEATAIEADGAETQDGTGLPEHFLLLATAPSRPGEVYGKIYECQEDYLSLVQSEWLGSPELMADTLQTEALARDTDSPLVLVGLGAAAISEILAARNEMHFEVSLAVEHIVVEVAIAGASALMSGEAADPLELQPLYLAPSAAERNLLGAGSSPKGR
ncbi:MAG: tRNA (adenosine(37)-N6)-threonylcarbamoyltransferase complex dimerization subunit type 1 TsaB [Abitibacteriaceae bacterium]|nr:tRNA (adenosine(37)-N6)-threonylcarbamoyltransferase complex dimerization subunit type 1 TsaB [Abditibacteriaceae bacterium]